MAIRKDKNSFPEDNQAWAQQIFRSQSGGKEYIFALIRRKFGDRDVETKGPGEYIGLKSDILYEMETDTDPDSATFNQRVPKEITVYDQTGKEIKQKVQSGIDSRPIHESTPAMLKKYRTLVGSMPKPYGDTQFYWLFKESRIQSNDVNEFFDNPLETVHAKLIKRRSLLTNTKADDKALDLEDDIVT